MEFVDGMKCVWTSPAAVLLSWLTLLHAFVLFGPTFGIVAAIYGFAE